MRVRTLGVSEVEIGQFVIRPDSTVAFGLALYLGVTAGDRVMRSRLLELFWPELPEAQARHALRQILYRLRRRGLELAESNEELRVDPQRVHCDFHSVLRPAWAENTDEDVARAVGTFLPDFRPRISGLFSEWLDELRRRVARGYSLATTRHMRAARSEGRWEDVMEWSTRCLAVDPLNEEATFGLAEASAMRGSKVAAVRILDVYSREIGDFDGRLGLSTRALHQRVSEAHRLDLTNTGHLALVGRVSEIARLVRLVESTLHGHGGAVAIVGVAGIGKSRLITETRREAVIRGFSCCAIGLQEGDARRPFSLLSQLIAQLIRLPGALGCAPESLATLRRILGDQELVASNETRQTDAAVTLYEVRESLADLLGSLESEGPLMVIVDDIQHGDAASGPILADIVERTSDSRVLWAIASRPSDHQPSIRLRATIELKPLPEPACGQLVRAAMPTLSQGEQRRLTEACVRIAGGNPFFAREVIQFWDRSTDDDRLPTTVARAVTDQISRLSVGAVRLLQTVTLLGSIASITRATQVFGGDTSELWKSLEELDSAGIIALSDDESVLVVHDIWKDEAVRGIRPVLKASMHARIADIVEEEAEQTRRVSLFWESARHRSQSGEPERAVRLMEACAAHLVAVGLPREAAETYRHAIAYCGTDRERLACHTRRISALHATGDWHTLQREIADAIAMSRRVDPSNDSHNELELLRTEALWRTETDAANAMDVAMACGRDTHATVEHRISALRLCAIVADNLCNDAKLQEAYDAVLRLAADNSRFVTVRLITSTVYHTSLGTLQAAIDGANELIEHERRRERVTNLGRALRFSTYPLRIAGHHQDAAENAREALAISTRYRLAEDAAICCDMLATMALNDENISSACEWTSHAENWARAAASHYLCLGAKILRARCGVAKGQWKDVVETLGPLRKQFSEDPIVNQGLSGLAVLADAFRIGNLDTELRAAVRSIEHSLPRSVRRGRVDTIVHSYCSALIFLNERTKAQNLLTHYCDHERRDRGSNLQLERLRTEMCQS